MTAPDPREARAQRMVAAAALAPAAGILSAAPADLFATNNAVAKWLMLADEFYGPDQEENVRIFRALMRVVDLHEGCTECNAGRTCQAIVAIAEELGVTERKD